MAVYGHLFTGLHYYHAAGRDLVRIYLLKRAVPFDIGVVWTDIHQCRDVPAALAHGVALEQLSYLVEQHYGYRLGKVAGFLVYGQSYGAYGGYGHEEVFIEDLMVDYAPEGLAQYIVAYGYIACGVERDPCPAAYFEQLHRRKQQGRYGYADKHFFLFPVHMSLPSENSAPLF